MRRWIVRILSGAIISSACLSLHTARAEAGINPDCVRMGKNRRQCTCALETGGQIKPDGSWKYYNAPRYTDCMRQKRWM